MQEAARSSQNAKPAQAKRQIRNFLIDRRFQLRWVFMVMVTVTLIVSFMGFFLYRTVAASTDQMVTQLLADDELTEASQQALLERGRADKMVTLSILVGSLFSLVVLLSLSTIVITHKVAGPIYKMRRVFSSINGDNLRLWDKLRRGDEFQEAFDDFSDMLSRLRENRRQDIEVLEGIRKLAGEQGNQEEILQKIDALVDRYNSSVKMT